ncbi:hypothetical protein [Paraburkholderia silvatlantica]|uniref:Uncharacterized protein n=1 Tax=Paraburkholderia silvatlantica TaxID=321895 RepID=A0ABR6FW80_9BURK|nr:hypothetical protein [Paraburkholderia silvatlantica]MBB2931288.1 hypothetical protein [Paraburkholderia silvatlantica]
MESLLDLRGIRNHHLGFGAAENWLALDNSVFDAHLFGRELAGNFVLLDSARGISDEKALNRLRQWPQRVGNHDVPAEPATRPPR